MKNNEERKQRIIELLEFGKSNSKGVCWSKQHYFSVKQILDVLEEIQINMALGATDETDRLVMEFLSESVFPGA